MNDESRLLDMLTDLLLNATKRVAAPEALLKEKGLLLGGGDLGQGSGARRRGHPGARVRAGVTAAIYARK